MILHRALEKDLQKHLAFIYPDHDPEHLSDQIMEAFWPAGSRPRLEPKPASPSSWSQENMILITYGDSILEKERTPLQSLFQFMVDRMDGLMSTVHILPFFPYSSDDGFAVKDYYAVNESLGSWYDIAHIGARFRLMADLVMNHASSQGVWFERFRQGQEPEKNYFVTADPQTDVSDVVRPRANPLLIPTHTTDGTRHVWCTFGADQVDLDFSNPQVLIEFVRIMRFYIENNVRVFRLDAVAFIWKTLGTPCINLPQVHAIIKLLHVLAASHKNNIVLITETNIPNLENLSYFGDGDEAHLIYNFSLPPLLVHALLTGKATYLRRWLMSMPPAPEGCAYLNFLASHDGIGLRPAEGLLPSGDLDMMIDCARRFGGKVTMRTQKGGVEKPYEMNIALFDMLKGTAHGEDHYGRERFLAAHAIMMAMEGIPAFYIHSMFGTPNAYDMFERTQQNRSLNRQKWQREALDALLDDPDNVHAQIFQEMKRLMALRIQQPAFHPNATRFTLNMEDGLFGFWRQSLDRRQSLFAITNLKDKAVPLHLQDLNLTLDKSWRDLITDTAVNQRDMTLLLKPYQTVWLTNY
jgi:sucrose phosphorylase